MANTSRKSIIISCIAFVLIFITASPAVLGLVKRLNPKKASRVNIQQHLEKYQDEDGAASNASFREYSVSVPRWVVVTTCSIGFLLSIVASIWGTISPSNLIFESWIASGSWVPVLKDKFQGQTADLRTDSARDPVSEHFS